MATTQHDADLRYELAPGLVYDANLGAAQDPEGVDLTLIDHTLSLTPDERVQRLDAWINSVRRLRAELHVANRND